MAETMHAVRFHEYGPSSVLVVDDVARPEPKEGEVVVRVRVSVAPIVALAHKPAGITFEQAATLPVGGVTAWVGLFDAAHLEAGQRVLAHGAAGGVGSLAVQLAHWKGAYVIATTSAANVAFVTSLGADEVIDYTAVQFEDVVSDMDVVYDAVGAGRSFPLARAAEAHAASETGHGRGRIVLRVSD